MMKNVMVFRNMEIIIKQIIKLLLVDNFLRRVYGLKFWYIELVVNVLEKVKIEVKSKVISYVIRRMVLIFSGVMW